METVGVFQSAVAVQIKDNYFKTVTSFFALGVKIPNVPLASWPPVQKQKTSALQYKANDTTPEKVAVSKRVVVHNPLVHLQDNERERKLISI